MKELSLHILDILENAVEAGASKIEISIDEDPPADDMVIVIRDNGRGMEPEITARTLDPFFSTRKTRHIGLGLPLFSEAARRCGRRLCHRFRAGEGNHCQGNVPPKPY